MLPTGDYDSEEEEDYTEQNVRATYDKAKFAKPKFAGKVCTGCYSGVLYACASPAMLWRTRILVTRSEATVERWMEAAWTTRGLRRSGPAEERAQPAEGLSRRNLCCCFTSAS
jgi:hypothetical protein